MTPSSLDVIKLAMNDNYGLARGKWVAQLKEIHNLPVLGFSVAMITETDAYPPHEEEAP